MGSKIWVFAILVMVINGCSGVDWFPTIGPDDPAFITVTASSSSPVAGTTVTITANVVKNDHTTAVADGTVVTFSTNGLGTLDFPSATTSGGIATVQLTSSTPGTITVTAAAGIVTGNGAVNFVSSLSVIASPLSISASLGGTSTISATVKDTNGTVKQGVTVLFVTNGGTLNSGSAVTDANGVASVILTVFPNSAVSGNVFTITANEQGTSNSGTATVTITP